MGEEKLRQANAQKLAAEARIVDTHGGRLHVHWDKEGSATPVEQFDFLQQKQNRGNATLLRVIDRPRKLDSVLS